MTEDVFPESGPSDCLMWQARDFQAEYGKHMCDADCGKTAEVHIIATRGDTGESKSVWVCKDHLLDPGPLLDY